MTCRITQARLADYRRFAVQGRVVVFDTETTGISRRDEVVQIAAVEYVKGERTRAFCHYVRPTCPVSPGAEAVHHLSDAFLAQHGGAPSEVLAAFFAFVGTDALLVAHNVHFDYRMVAYSCRRAGLASDWENLAFCDTLALAKKLVPDQPCYRLGELMRSLSLAGENSHDALDDTLACGALFFTLIRSLVVKGGLIYAP